jgi:hypothetical protein
MAFCLRTLSRIVAAPARHRPFFLDVFQGQVEQLEDRLVVWEQTPVLDDFPQALIERFNVSLRWRGVTK